METSKFKTNIKCTGCIEKVTPFLNETVGKENWSVDLNDPAKVLTVQGEHEKSAVVKALEKAGYKAESL
jgi:copper chaperone